MRKLDWHGLYGGSWQGEIVPEAFAHPAKFSRALIRQIYQHMLACGYIAPGDSVIDPFGGVGLGALDAMRNGLHWTGVELESKFVDLGNQNITLWNERYSQWLPTWGSAVLLQGDSRQLVQLVGRAGAAVSSPPYTGAALGHDAGCVRLDEREDNRRLNEGSARRPGYGSTNGQLGSMPEGSYQAAVSSPPFSGDKNLMPVNGQGVRSDMAATGKKPESQTQQSPGNLAMLKADEAGFQAAVSSPPYGDAVAGNGEGPGARHDHIYHNGDNATKKSSQAEYGRTEGNLGNMDAAVSSPPFSDCNVNIGAVGNTPGQRQQIHNSSKRDNSYGSAPGNVGNDSGATFWSAARVIVEQVYQVLKPGGYAAWVTGNFRRNGEIVDFGGQWLALCEAVGFTGVEHITAWKVERRGVQLDMWGNEHKKDVYRISFFRRLDNEKNPDAPIESEDVWIVQKPPYPWR